MFKTECVTSTSSRLKIRSSCACMAICLLALSQPAQATETILFVPYCFEGTQSDFEALVEGSMDFYYEKFFLTECSQGTEEDGRYYFHEAEQKTLIGCPGDPEDLETWELEALTRAVKDNFDDYSSVWFITDYDPEGCAGGVQDGRLFLSGYDGWEMVFTHEMGHALATLQDEYLNQSSSINSPRAKYGCDPTGPCCEVTHPCGGEDLCHGNLSVVPPAGWEWGDPTPPQNSSDHRCIMSFSSAGSGDTLNRHWCPMCLAHLATHPNVPRCPGKQFPIPIIFFEGEEAEWRINLECTNPNGEYVVLDGSNSYDPDGDPITFSWESDSIPLSGSDTSTVSATFPIGTSMERIEMTISDDDGTDSKGVSISVYDSTPPTLAVEEFLTVSTCGLFGSIPIPEVSDLCSTSVELEAMLWGVTPDNPDASVPVPVTLQDLENLPIGIYRIDWRATDANGKTASATQTVQIIPSVRADHSYRVLNGAMVVDVGGALSTVINSGTDVSYMEVDARVGDIHSNARVELRNNVYVGGSVFTPANVHTEPGAYIEGSVVDQTLDIAPVSMPDTSFPLWNDGDVNLEPWQFDSIPPGSYANLNIKSNATLQMEPGVYWVNGISLEPQGQIELTGDGVVEIYVKYWMNYRGYFSGTSTVQLGMMASSALFLEQPFYGRIIAPDAEVVLRGDFFGELYAHRIVIDPYRTLTCVPLPSSTQPTYSCADGIKNGTESGVDCGGDCSPCDNGQPCNFEEDCGSAYCYEGVCIPEDSCWDGAMNNRETDVDCGGGVCPGCDEGESCKLQRDCGNDGDGFSWDCNSSMVCEASIIV